MKPTCSIEHPSAEICAALLKLGGPARMAVALFKPSTAEMTQRVEINLFFETGLYLVLFASSAGGL